jgi:OOP family OmpA-OmpF porin
MVKTSRLVVAGSLLGVLAACATPTPDRVNQMQAGGTAFDQALKAEYAALAEKEYDLYDWRDSGYFAGKAMTAAEGQNVFPTELGEWNLPEYSIPDLESGRARLVNALNGGARTANPEVAARAQASYDCWVEEQEENWQPDMIANCRGQFLQAMATLEGPPAEPVAAGPRTFLTFFAWDSARLRPNAERVIELAAADIQQVNPSRVLLRGHADTSGAADYNVRLSARRADAVAEALTRAGVSPGLIETQALGETDLRVPTPDGVREPENRNVEIILEGAEAVSSGVVGGPGGGS